MPHRSKREKYPVFWLLLLAVLIYHRYLQPGMLINARDLLTVFYPFKHFWTGSLLSGIAPWWTDSIGCGQPFMANLAVQAFYPPALLFLFLPLGTAMGLTVVLHAVLSGSLMFSFVRRLGMSVPAAFLSSTVWMTAGSFAAHLDLLNQFCALAWAPGLLLALDAALERPERTASWIVLGLILSVQFLAGHPPTFGMTVLFAAGWFWIRSGRINPPVRAWLTPLVLFVTALAFLPAAELSRHAMISGGYSPEEAARESLSWSGLTSLVFPWGFLWGYTSPRPSDLAAFAGLVPLALAFSAVFLRNIKYRWGLLALGASGLLLALGDSLPFFGWLQQHLPGASYLRQPYKWIFFFHIMIAVLSGLALDKILVRRGWTAAAWSLVLLAAAELGLFAGGLYAVAPTEMLLTPPPQAEWLSKNPGRFFIAPRTAGTFERLGPLHWPETLARQKSVLFPNMPLFYGLQAADSRSALRLARTQNLLNAASAQNSPGQTALLEMLSVRHVVSFGGLRDHRFRLEQTGHPSIFSLPSSPPLAWTTHRVRYAPDDRTSLLVVTDRKFDPDREVVLTTPLITDARVLRPSPGDRVTILKWDRGNIGIKTTMGSDGWLIVSQSWFPGWKAQVDGREERTAVADHAITGLPLSKGDHEVVLSYDPAPARTGGTVSAMVLLILLAGGMFGSRIKGSMNNGRRS